MLRKLKTLNELKTIVQRLKAQGQRVVFANGCFDILHGGHISYLQAAREAGDCLIVALNSDASIRKIKGPDRPILPENERLILLDAIRYVDYLILFDEPTVMGLLEALRPDAHAKGTDYTLDTIPERETTRALGIEVMIAGAPKQNASRDIIARTRAGQTQ
ncbi:MAG: adenylyltransferase/cytidyltransferase family protein [Candidatus Sumerlaeota bacterium]|nr:adenylyltransferase/cytidyltransferase family protein [Candidatus Sumerlaeota bacterium]